MLDAYLLKNSLLTTSFNKYFQPSLLNKNTKVKLLYSAVKLGLKDLWVRKYESPQITLKQIAATGGYSHPSDLN